MLSVDGTGKVLTVAVRARGRVLQVRRSGRVPHDESLLPAVESLLRRAGLTWKNIDAVAAASGPGRFTGIRIGMSFAAMLALKLKIPALAVSRLEAAAIKSGMKSVLAALPGWKEEVYHQTFRQSGPRWKAVGEPGWCAPAEWPAVAGEFQKNGFYVAYGETDASDLLLAAESRLAAKSLPKFEPFYLKPAGYEKKPR